MTAEVWGVGVREPGSPYLTVIGSTYGYGTYASLDQAEARLADVQSRGWADAIIARVQPFYHSGVTVTHTAFRIVQVAS